MSLKSLTAAILAAWISLFAMPEAIAGLTQETPVVKAPVSATDDSTVVAWSAPAGEGLAVMGTLFRALGIILGLTLLLYLGLRF